MKHLLNQTSNVQHTSIFNLLKLKCWKSAFNKTCSNSILSVSHRVQFSQIHNKDRVLLSFCISFLSLHTRYRHSTHWSISALSSQTQIKCRTLICNQKLATPLGWLRSNITDRKHIRPAGKDQRVSYSEEMARRDMRKLIREKAISSLSFSAESWKWRQC